MPSGFTMETTRRHMIFAVTLCCALIVLSAASAAATADATQCARIPLSTAGLELLRKDGKGAPVVSVLSSWAVAEWELAHELLLSDGISGDNTGESSRHDRVAGVMRLALLMTIQECIGMKGADGWVMPEHRFDVAGYLRGLRLNDMSKLSTRLPDDHKFLIMCRAECINAMRNAHKALSAFSMFGLGGDEEPFSETKNGCMKLPEAGKCMKNSEFKVLEVKVNHDENAQKPSKSEEKPSAKDKTNDKAHKNDATKGEKEEEDEEDEL